MGTEQRHEIVSSLTDDDDDDDDIITIYDEDDDDCNTIVITNKTTTTTTINNTTDDKTKRRKKILRTIAGLTGNVLEWYDFALFGSFSDVIGDVFFPPQKGHAALIESFIVFGTAFLFRPVGGILIGSIGDRHSPRTALELSILLMAIPTFLLGCLPSYAAIGLPSTLLLIFVRILQGLSVGGQMMSSLVVTLQSYERKDWGYYGSFVFVTSSLGSFLGSLVGWIVRERLGEEEVRRWGWRVPFLSGVIVGLAAIYLRYFDEDEDEEEEGGRRRQSRGGTEETKSMIHPIKEVFHPSNRRSLLSCTLVPTLEAAGAYVTFTWLPIYMNTLLTPPIPHAFGINSLSNLLGRILMLPLMGYISDNIPSSSSRTEESRTTSGRQRLMIVAGALLSFIGPISLDFISQSMDYRHPLLVCFVAQVVIGSLISAWTAPMSAWLAESVVASRGNETKLTSVSLGYNLALGTVGGLGPAVATLMVDHWGVTSPGFIYTVVAGLAVGGLFVAPVGKERGEAGWVTVMDEEEEEVDDEGGALREEVVEDYGSDFGFAMTTIK